VATNTISGTSMATPHVAGASALYLSGHPTATPAAVAAALTGNATTGVVIGPGSGSPNRFLYTGFITSGGSALYLVSPCRLLDTRNANGPLGGPSLAAGAIRNVSVVGVCGVPSGAAALATNITAIAPFSSGWLTLYGGPLSSSRPLASTLNYATGKTLANNALIPVGSDGTINIFNSGPGSVGFIIDISGYFK
jgi:subtilisin family serine protease